ncbi:MAG: hypothetical protein R2851_07725 [Caldilineaceae bacterium]
MVRTQTVSPEPRTHMTALLSRSTPQKYSVPSSATDQFTSACSWTDVPSGWRMRATIWPSTMSQRFSWPSSLAHHSASLVDSLRTVTSGMPTALSARQSLPANQSR